MIAETLALLLLDAFNTGLNTTEEQRRAGFNVGRPWSWVSNDPELAGALGQVMRSIGVLAPEGVALAGDEENGIAERGWSECWRMQIVRMGH